MCTSGVYALLCVRLMCTPYVYALRADLAIKLRLRHTAVLHAYAHMETPYFEADLPRVQVLLRNNHGNQTKDHHQQKKNSKKEKMRRELERERVGGREGGGEGGRESMGRKVEGRTSDVEDEGEKRKQSSLQCRCRGTIEMVT